MRGHARAEVPPAAVRSLAIVAGRVRDAAVGRTFVPVLPAVPTRVVVGQGLCALYEYALVICVSLVVEFATMS